MCTYISGSLCLTANNMFFPRHGGWQYDQYLADVALSFVEEMVQQVSHEPLKKARDVFTELMRYAHAVALQISDQDTCFQDP